jgi:DNA-binding CsgD family transcriptional regulator
MNESGQPALTKRETEVLTAVSTGMTCREISIALSMSEATAKTHRRNLMAKFGTSNAAHLLARARELQLLAPASSPLCVKTLSPRELDVLELLAIGMSSKHVARRLGISDLTVRKHRENLLKKLGLRSTARLAALLGSTTSGVFRRQ